MWLCKTFSNSFIRIKYYYYCCYYYYYYCCYYYYHHYYYYYYYYYYCWKFVPVTAEQPCDSSISKCPRDNVCLEIPFRVSLYHKKSSQLITIKDKLAGFFMIQFLLKCIYEQILVYVRKYFSVETCPLQKPVNSFAM